MKKPAGTSGTSGITNVLSGIKRLGGNMKIINTIIMAIVAFISMLAGKKEQDKKDKQ